MLFVDESRQKVSTAQYETRQQDSGQDAHSGHKGHESDFPRLSSSTKGFPSLKDSLAS